MGRRDVTTTVLLLAAAWACSPAPVETVIRVFKGADPARVTHGVAAGEVTATTAVVWTRCDRESPVRVVLHMPSGKPEITAATTVRAADDFTAKVALTNLDPDTQYTYRLWCGDRDEASAVNGTFRTAPAAGSLTPVTFVWGGDVGGQNVCRDKAEGYRVFTTIAAQRPDFFIGLGDMIYADSPCNPTGLYGNEQVEGPSPPATDIPGFWERWRYNREDGAFQRLLASTGYYAVWDDHEVYNDFGPQHDVGRKPAFPAGRHLLPLGRKAYLDYNPFPPARGAPPRLYRAVRWGKHLELFFLDTRSYRDANGQKDNPRNPKTMLGREQLAWLKDRLERSDATWKIIVSSVPLSVPTGDANARDGWGDNETRTGFEYELLDILRFLQAHGIDKHVWISTDVHFATVFRYTPFANAPDFHVLEVDTGPLNAGVFPKAEFDQTLRGERLFSHPTAADPRLGFERAKSWFNFGVMRVAADGRLTIQIINAKGEKLYEISTSPQR